MSLSKTAAHSDGAESRHSRRFWLRAGVLAASLALVGLATIRFWPRPQHRVAAHDLAAAVGSWTKTVGMPPVGWTTTQPLPAGFSLPQGIPVRPNSWRSFKTREGWPSIAIDYSSSGRPATLFIVRSSAQFAVPTIPFTRLPSSGPAMAAWQKGNLLYVLVVFENGQRLEDFIHPPTLS